MKEATVNVRVDIKGWKELKQKMEKLSELIEEVDRVVEDINNTAIIAEASLPEDKE